MDLEAKIARDITFYNERQLMLTIRNVWNWKKMELEMRDNGIRTGRNVICADCGVIVASDHLESCHSRTTGVVQLKRA
jgi:hypothetical protein